MATAYCPTCRVVTTGTRIAGKPCGRCGTRLAGRARCAACEVTRSPGRLYFTAVELCVSRIPISRTSLVLKVPAGNFVCGSHWLAQPPEAEWQANGFQPATFTRFDVPGTIQVDAQVVDLLRMGRKVTGYAGGVR